MTLSPILLLLPLNDGVLTLAGVLNGSGAGGLLTLGALLCGFGVLALLRDRFRMRLAAPVEPRTTPAD